MTNTRLIRGHIRPDEESEMGDQVVTKAVLDRMGAAKADFEIALGAAQAARDASPNAAIAHLAKALAYYSRSITDGLIAISEQIDDVNRNVNNVAARLDGRPGPFNLRMR
jgi:hypothetical protein